MPRWIHVAVFSAVVSSADTRTALVHGSFYIISHIFHMKTDSETIFLCAPCILQSPRCLRRLRSSGKKDYSGDDFMNMSLYSVRYLIRQRIHAHVSDNGGFGELHIFSSCRWTLEPLFGVCVA